MNYVANQNVRTVRIVYDITHSRYILKLDCAALRIPCSVILFNDIVLKPEMKAQNQQNISIQI